MVSLDFSGVFVVLLTPFNAEGNVALDVMDSLVDFYVESGVDGIFPCGSAGEAIHLSFDQKAELIRRVAKRAAGRVQVLPGAIASNAHNALALAEVAREAGCNGIIATPPIYYKFEPAYIRQYFQTILDGAGMPVVLYNIPVYAQPLEPKMLGELAHHPNVAGIKDSSGSMVDFLHFIDATRSVEPKIGFMSGREEMLFASLAVGGSGSISAINAVVPEVMVRIRDLFRAGDFAGSNALQMSLMDLIRAMYDIQVPIGFRDALTMRGFPMGEAVHAPPERERPLIAPKLAIVQKELDTVLKAHKEAIQ